jgi:hypothetical protein
MGTAVMNRRCPLLSNLILIPVFATSIVSGEGPPFKITTKRNDDRVTVKTEKEKAIIDVQCPFGISGVVIERTSEKWPDAVTIRLRLKGLENIQLSNGTTTLHGTVSNENGKARLWLDGEEGTPLDALSPFWMTIRLIGSDGNAAPALPKDGAFEMQLPRALFAANPKSVSLKWIDFYRN